MQRYEICKIIFIFYCKAENAVVIIPFYALLYSVTNVCNKKNINNEIEFDSRKINKRSGSNNKMKMCYIHNIIYL